MEAKPEGECGSGNQLMSVTIGTKEWLKLTRCLTTSRPRNGKSQRECHSTNRSRGPPPCGSALLPENIGLLGKEPIQIGGRDSLFKIIKGAALLGFCRSVDQARHGGTI